MDYKIGDKVKVVAVGYEVTPHQLKTMKDSRFEIFIDQKGAEDQYMRDHHGVPLVKLNKIEGPFPHAQWWIGVECLAHENDEDVEMEPKLVGPRVWKVGDEIICARRDVGWYKFGMDKFLGLRAVIRKKTAEGGYYLSFIDKPDGFDGEYRYIGTGFDPVNDEDVQEKEPVVAEENKAPVKLKYKAGDNVICVEDKNKIHIRKGKIYQVHKCTDKHVTVVNDNGALCSYDLVRFKKATKAIIAAYEAKVEDEKQAAAKAKADKEAAERAAKEAEEKLAKQVGYAKLRKHVMARGGGVCAVYTVQYANGRFCDGTTACHAAIGGYAGGKRVALVENIAIQHAKAVVRNLGEQYKRFANYVINESPVRDCFIPEGIDKALKHGQLYNVNRPIEELVVAANMLREGGEFANLRLELFGEILDAGFSGKVAYLLSYCVSDNLQYRGFCNSHKCMSDDMNAEETLLFYREGFHQTKDKKAYNDYTGSYSGIARWMAKRSGPGIGQFMREGLKPAHGGGGFGGGGAAVTKENLYSFAAILETKVTKY
jgi:hypothetical protein